MISCVCFFLGGELWWSISGGGGSMLFEKRGQPEYFWGMPDTPFNAKHPFNNLLAIAILQKAFK